MDEQVSLLPLALTLGIGGSLGMGLYPLANRWARTRGAAAHWRIGWLLAVPSMTAMLTGWLLLARNGPHLFQAVTAPFGVVIFALSVLIYATSARLVGRLRGPGTYSLELRASGIYRWVRHPQALALVLGGVGVGLICGSVPFYLSLPVWIAVWTAYTYLEERFELVPAFGPAYEEYRKCTPRMLPDLRRLAAELGTRSRRRKRQAARTAGHRHAAGGERPEPPPGRGERRNLACGSRRRAPSTRRPPATPAPPPHRHPGPRSGRRS